MSQLGTAFLACPEAVLAPAYRAAHLDTAMWAGQAAARLRTLPAAELLATLARETQAARGRE